MTVVRPEYSLEWHTEALVSANDRCAIFRPRCTPSRKLAIIALHGAGGGADDLALNYKQGAVMLGMLATVGFTVLVPDCGDITLAGGRGSAKQSWGRDAATARIEAWRQWLVSQGYEAERIGLLGYSMGGYNVTAYARDYPEHVAAITTWNGAVDMAYIRANRTNPSFPEWVNIAAEFDTSWGLTSASATPAEADLLQAQSLKGIPWWGFWSNNDPFVPTDSASKMATWIGSSAKHTDVGAVGHFAPNNAPAYFDEIVSFYREHCFDTSQRVSAQSFGIAEPPWYAYEGTRGGVAGVDARLDEMIALGATWWRVDINWNNIATNNGAWTNFVEWDQMVQRARAKGIKVLGILMAAPSGASAPDPTAFITNWLTNHEKPDAIEVMNEQNTGMSGWDINWGPSGYATFLSKAYDAVKAVDARIPVGFGGMAAFGDGRNPAGYEDATTPTVTYPASYTQLVDNRNMDPVSYVRKVLDALTTYKATKGRYPWDFVCHHPYANWSDLIVGGVPAVSLMNLKAMHDVLVSKGDPGFVWITEYGVSNVTVSGFSEGQSEATVAQWTNDLFDWWVQQTWTGHCFMFTLDTLPTEGDRTRSYALLTEQASTPPLGTRRNTWTSLRDAIASHT